MIRILDLHEDELLIAVKSLRDALKTLKKGVLVVIHGYGSSGSQSTFKKLTEVRNIGNARVKKGELTLCVSGPDLNDVKIRAMFTTEEITKLNTYITNSGVTIIKK